MKCKKCGNELTGHQTSYCSYYCSKLHLKSLYKKRNKDKINAYHREYRKKINDDTNRYRTTTRKNHLKEHQKCSKCGKENNLEVHHILPRKYAGTHHPDNLLTLCRFHHYKLEKLTKKVVEDYLKTIK